MFEEYLGGSTDIKPEDLHLAYLSYSNNAEKFKKILELQLSTPVTDEQFESVISAF